jgi:adenylate cyclase
MSALTRDDIADRAGVDGAYVDRLVTEGILVPQDGGFIEADARRVRIMQSLEESGVTVEAVAAGIRRGLLDLGFVSGQEYERFANLSRETFEEVSRRTGVPVSTLLLIREATGTGAVHPAERLREDEQEIVPFIQLQHELGFSTVGTERLLRAMSDSLRRVAEAEAEWWRSEVTQPRLQEGTLGSAVGGSDISGELSRRAERAVMAVFRGQEAQTWTANITDGFSYLLAHAGLHEALARPPAICFLDITGYTRLTQERGDRAAADLAEELARLVKRTSVQHGGRPVKWLGDGVMFWYRDPGPAVMSALDMVDGVASAGLPPAHVGLHAGPVVIQEGDYYGQTVNMAARIADYARPGEVLVSRSIVDSATSGGDIGVMFAAIGAVELKGVTGTTELHVARRKAAL